MICSSCSTLAPIGVRTEQKALGRQCSWWQCFGCFNAEAERVAAERNERNVVIKRGRK